jgi:two-component system, OmpR family, alkaline phosphatase synthesis response regulator PhoP
VTEKETKTILVVDDEPDVRRYLKAILDDAGFRVVTAEDGEAALEIIKAEKPDFISLDLMMPRKSGHKLLYELKKDKALEKIPVLIVTAHARDELGSSDLTDLLDNRVLSGPGVYLEKPVNPTTYVRSIQRALGMAESPEADSRANLKERLAEQMKNAPKEALEEALKALKARLKE